MQTRSEQTVLVVDDNEATRYAVVRRLRAGGFQTMDTASGAHALELAEYASAAVLDVNLPDVHGFEVARLLRVHPRTAGLPIVHLSAERVTPADVKVGLEFGADEYLVAPVEPETLLAVLDRLIEHASARSGMVEQREWRHLHHRLMQEEQRLFALARGVGRNENSQAELEQAQENIRALRDQAEAALQAAVGRLRAG